jgi:hypothetical protein
MEVGAFTDCWTMVMLAVFAGTAKVADSPTLCCPRSWTCGAGAALRTTAFVQEGAPVLPPGTVQEPPGLELVPQEAAATKRGRAKRALDRMWIISYRDGTAGRTFKDEAN